MIGAQLPDGSVAHSQRLVRFMVVLLAACVLSGCSTLRLAYNNVDEVVYWWLDGYLDLEKDQARRVREDIGALHAWHRGRELPRLESWLHEIERLAPGDISTAQACSWAPPLRGFVKSLADQAEPALVTLAVALGPEQLRHLEQKYSRNNAKFRKEWVQLNPRELLEKRYAAALERSERVYGRLGSAQRALLRQQLQTTAFNPERSLAERQVRQQETLRLLRGLAEQRPGMAQARAQVQALLERLLASSQGAYAETLVQENCSLVAAMHNSMTPAQRDTAVQRLRGWQRDLRELASQL